MNSVIRSSLLALAVAGGLSLAACKTTDDSMEAPAPEPAPMQDSMPADPATPPADNSTTDDSATDDSMTDDSSTPTTP